MKKDGGKNFDVTMGSVNEAEVCELVGIYNILKIGEKYGKEKVVLHRDDSLACFENTSGPESGKRLSKLFQIEFNLDLACKANPKVVNVLDLLINLPFLKYGTYSRQQIIKQRASSKEFPGV